MKIIWHSNAPWTSTGYGAQTALFTPLIRDLGHQVIISAFHGIDGGALTWQGIPVIPGATKNDPYGAELLAAHAAREKADLVIAFSDIWVIDPTKVKDLPLAYWMPVDCEPLSEMDKFCLTTSGAAPIAISQFGARQLEAAGFTPHYVPHGLDDAYLARLPSKAEARDTIGIPADVFAVGINAANKDGFRKGMYPQMAAFARLHADHPDTVLLFHGQLNEAGALDVTKIAASLGILPALRASDQYANLTGQIGVDKMVCWYRALDLYSGCSLGEGFGIPIIEAQACGVPVVVTDAASMTELASAGGWKVPAEPFWHPSHHALWRSPVITEIHKVYERAYQRGAAYQSRQAKARQFAAQYECGRITAEHWAPTLAALDPAGLKAAA